MMRWTLPLAAATFLLTCPALAGIVDNFDALPPGPLNGQNGWVSDQAAANVGDDLNRPGDHVARQSGDSNDLYRPLGANAIANGQTSTLAFRFMATGAQANHGFGVTEVDAPSAWTQYRATALIFNDGRTVKMRGRSGGAYVDLTLNGGANGLSVLTWYDAWVVVNNAADTADFYLKGPADAAPRQVGAGLPFRNGATTAALDTFYSRVDSGTTDPVIFDDVRVTPGLNLSAPAAKAAPTLNPHAALALTATKLEAVDARLSATAYPSITGTSGTWTTTSASSWTSGFFPGTLWQMYGLTGDNAWRTRAEARTAGIESQKTNSGTHDLGFMIFNSFGQGYKLTGNTDYRDVCLTAANTLATRYSPTVGAIQSWGNKTTGAFEVIIDNMMNLELLFWAAANGGPASLRDIAIQHALTTRAEHVRPDGGTYHVVLFDRTTGDVLDKYTSQGYNDESTWSRGQAWGVYGFTMAYRETGDARFLETACLMADYFIGHLGPGQMPYYDFQDPANQPPWDSSAAAIVASALLELKGYVDPADAARYFNAAETMLLTLTGPAFLSGGTTFESLLMQGSVSSAGANHVGTSYGDYYLVEALTQYLAPEPATLSLLALGGLVVLRRRTRKA